jgi:hypothetical protein
MREIHRKIEVVANLAIIIIAAALGLLMIGRYVRPVSMASTAEANQIKPGTQLSLDGIDWSTGKANVVLAISTSCRFCRESVPFYQKLAKQRGENAAINLIAVLPQEIQGSDRFLKEHEIHVDAVRTVKLSEVSVNATPTLMVVDQTGSVVESWVGKLTPEKEKEVLSRVFGKDAGL